MKSRRRWWTIYIICAATLCVALSWISATVLRLENAEFEARAEAEQQESLRLALWRMDSWVAPYLAREAARPYFEYQSFYPQQGAYARLLNQTQADEVLAPSPLMSFASPYFRIHFQIGPDGSVTSPQAPAGEFRHLAAGQFMSTEQIDAGVALIRRLSAVITVAVPVGSARGGRNQAVAELSAALEEDLKRAPETETPAPEQQMKSAAEFNKRKGLISKQTESPNLASAANAPKQRLDTVESASESTDAAASEADEIDTQPRRQERRVDQDVLIDVGPLTPLWFVDPDSQLELMFYRNVVVGGRGYIQGVVCDWQRLQSDLLTEVSDLLSGATLEPARGGAQSHSGMMLASLPAALSYPSHDAAAVPLFSAARIAIGLTWLAVLTALIAVAVTLSSSIAFGERRSRFASAVTHELRTPLTSFQMYTEMLADGMVTDQARTRQYLQTLKTESARLATLVENVLYYARLEEGRRPAEQRDVTTHELMSEISPRLRQRAIDASMELNVDWAGVGDVHVTTDVEAVGQILLNLVDNACKYGLDGGSIEVTVSKCGQQLEIGVRDHGGGVAEGDAEAIFSPFHRGRHENSEKPGIGLGLALSRGLARDLGGGLSLGANGDGGAHFILQLPLTR